MPLRIFLSWSKARSRQIASALQVLLKDVFQDDVEGWMSVDIDKGIRWPDAIVSQLGTLNLGLTCLTPENLEEPWLLYEAGALSKYVDGHLWTYLHELQPANISWPLAQFQHTVSTREDTFKLMRSINGLRPMPSPDDRLTTNFNAFWDRFSQQLKEIGPPTVPTESRTIDDMISEVLTILRGQDSVARWAPSPQHLEWQFRSGSPGALLGHLVDVWLDPQVTGKNGMP